MQGTIELRLFSCRFHDSWRQYAFYFQPTFGGMEINGNPSLSSSRASDIPIGAIAYLSTDIAKFPPSLRLCFETKSAYTLCLQLFVTCESFLGLGERV